MKFRIYRYDPEQDSAPRVQEYDVALDPHDRMLLDALVRAVNDPSLRESLLAQGITPDPGSAQQFGAVLASEAERLSKLIDDAKIQP